MTLLLHAEQIRRQQLDIWTSTVANMRKEKAFTDIVIVCGNKEFPAHRVVLSGGSTYFRAMLQNPMLEATTGTIGLKTLDPEAVGIVLDFIYTGRLSYIGKDVALLRAVLEVAHMFQVQLLFEYALQLMRMKLSADYFLDLMEVAILYNESELLNQIQTFVINMFESVSSSDDFNALSFAQLLQLLQHPKMSNAPMDDVFAGVLNWVKTDATNRCIHLSELLSTLDLNRLSAKCIKRFLSSEPIVLENQDVFGKLVEASLQYLERDTESPIALSLFCFSRNANRQYVSTIFTVGSNCWSPPTVLSFPLPDSATVVAFEDDIYFVGGRWKNGEISNAVVKYSSELSISTVVLKLRFCVSYAAAADLHGLIYVVGGCNEGGTPSKIVQRFDPLFATSEIVAATHEPHCYPFIGQVSGKLYVGGRSLFNTAMEEYNPHMDQWTLITSGPRLKTCCGGAFAEGKIYLVPNFRDPSEVHVYDCLTHNWEEKVVLEAPTSFSRAWTVRARGPDRSVLLMCDLKNRVYLYSPGNDRWISLPRLKVSTAQNIEFCVVARKADPQNAF